MMQRLGYCHGFWFHPADPDTDPRARRGERWCDPPPGVVTRATYGDAGEASFTVVGDEPSLVGEIVAALLRFPERATRPRWLREMLLLGLKLGEDGGRDALAVLERWAGTTIYQPEDDWPTRVAAAQAWFAEKYPDQLPPHLPAEGVAARWRYEPLVALLKKSPPGDIQRGREVFAKARCHLCHRSDGQGETLGPDLTGLGNRLQLKEMVYATIFPSEWVSDQYTTYTVETTDGRIFTGLVGRQGNDKLVVLESSGNKQFLPQRAIERSVAQPLSIMPSDLLEPLSEQEVLDLFAFLRRRSSSDD